MPIAVLLHDPGVAESRDFFAKYGGQLEVRTPDAEGNPPIPYLQGYPSVMYDVPAHRMPEQEMVGRNPDGTLYTVTIPAYNVPATKALIFNPPDLEAVQALVDEARQRAVENPPV